MASRKWGVTPSKPQFQIDAVTLVDVFHDVWRRALAIELITTANMEYAARDILRSVLSAAEASSDANRIAQTALNCWHAESAKKYDLDNYSAPPPRWIN